MEITQKGVFDLQVNQTKLIMDAQWRKWKAERRSQRMAEENQREKEENWSYNGKLREKQTPPGKSLLNSRTRKIKYKKEHSLSG